MRYPKDYHKVEARHIKAWLHAQERKIGKRAYICDYRVSPIDLFLSEVYGLRATFLVGAEIELDNGDIVRSELINVGYYMMSSSGRLHTRLRAWVLMFEQHEDDQHKLFA